MKNLSRYLVTLLAAALFAVAMVGCSGQQASSGSASEGDAASSASESAEAATAATPDELIAELEAVSGKDDYKSVTMDMEGTVSVDMGSMTATGDSGDSAGGDEAGEGDDASASADAAEGDDASASADAAVSDAAASESSMMNVPMTIKAKCDISDDKVKMSMDMDMMGMAFQLFVNGDNAVMVTQGQAIEATLDELNMGQYSSVDSILKSQGGDLSAFKSSIKSIEKTVEGDESVYTIECDPAKFLSANDSMESLSQLGGLVSFDTVKLVYRVSADGLLTGLDMDLKGDSYSMTMNTKLYDYDKTVVDPAPEATMKYSELMEEEAADDAAEEAADESVDEDAEATDESGAGNDEEAEE